jgi:hypothetical protein
MKWGYAANTCVVKGKKKLECVKSLDRGIREKRRKKVISRL